MVQNGPKWSKIFQKCFKGPISFKKNAPKMLQNGQKQFKIIPNVPKRSNIVQSGPKQSKTDQDGPIRSTWFELVQNT